MEETTNETSMGKKDIVEEFAKLMCLNHWVLCIANIFLFTTDIILAYMGKLTHFNVCFDIGCIMVINITNLIIYATRKRVVTKILGPVFSIGILKGGLHILDNMEKVLNELDNEKKVKEETTEEKV